MPRWKKEMMGFAPTEVKKINPIRQMKQTALIDTGDYRQMKKKCKQNTLSRYSASPIVNASRGDRNNVIASQDYL